MPYRDALEDEGYEVEVAYDPKGFMSAALKKVFDAVIIDVLMPHGDELNVVDTQGGLRTGLVLARWIKKIYPWMPIVGFTIRADE
jgi:DNA-binding response OmpR family regulator